MTQGIIAAGNEKTAAAGAEILRDGGNAVDAAVAAAFTRFIAEPTLVSPGGGGVGLVFIHDGGQARLYDFFVNAPGLGLTPETKPDPADFYSITIDYGPATQSFHVGRASVATPGLIAGLCKMQTELGRLPLPVVLQPAIHAARYGLPLGQFGAVTGELLRDIFSADPHLAQLMGAPAHFLHPDHRYKNEALADTLEALGREGPDLFYKGAIARAIVQDQQKHRGLLTAQDLASYQVIVRKPLHQRYRQYEFFTNPPPSRGGALIAFSLALLQNYPLARMTFGESQQLALLAEVMRQTNLARPFFDASGDVQAFLSSEHLQKHAAQLAQRLSANPKNHPYDAPAPFEHNNTSHISVLDANGNQVALTTTAGETPGFIVPGTGLILNNILGEADLHPEGFLMGTPGQRIGSMMAPTLVLHDGEPVLAVGSGGANRIRSAILQVLLNYLDFGMPLQAAVDAPRIHFEENAVQMETGYAAGAVEKMRQWGYDVTVWPTPHMFFGGAHSVGRTTSGAFEGAGDFRRAGAVVQVA
jgi:gamma-glutamyltranspeptidase/glutathione hydrolase